MTHRKLKLGYFTLEALNAFAMVYFVTYIFFYLQAEFDFGNLENLGMSAICGLVYCLSAWYGGRCGQRWGYFTALKIGYTLLTLGMGLGWQTSQVGGQVVTMMMWSLGLCFIWPNLEALASEDEDRQGLTRMVGIYNVVWASFSGAAAFVGGALVESLGWKSVFWIPGGIYVTQGLLTLWLERRYVREHRQVQRHDDASPVGMDSVARPGPTEGPTVGLTQARLFQKMAWLANPFAHIAISTVIPLIPALARRFDLTPTYAGFFCSVWLFARLGTFVLLWQWTRWHYRFGWLASAYLMLVLSFAALFFIPNLGMVVVAQVFFGWAIGVIYYSSLFYSMDASATKGVHGGIHESALGVGLFAGPALGAAALRFFPGQTHVTIWAVSGLLVLGWGGLCWLRQTGRRS